MTDSALSVTVITRDGQSIKLDCHTTDTIGSLWAHLPLSTDLRREVQFLARYDDQSQTPLDDKKTLAECSFKKQDEKLFVWIDHDGPCEVYTKTPSGKTLTVKCDPAKDTVTRVKHAVQDKEGIPPREQRWMSMGKRLEEGKVLSEYGVKNESTLIGGML